MSNPSIVFQRSVSGAQILAAAHAAGRPVRFWLNTANEIVGIWQTKSGRTNAVGGSWQHGGKTQAFATMEPLDKWVHGGKPATLQDMTKYRRAEMLARKVEH